MTMFSPPYPGELLREDVIEALGQNVTEAARCLGMSRVAFELAGQDWALNGCWVRRKCHAMRNALVTPRERSAHRN